jgi:hypothetical protein
MLLGSGFNSIEVQATRYPASLPLRLVVLLDDLLKKVDNFSGSLLYAGLPCEYAPLWVH